MVKISQNGIKTELFLDCGIGSGSFILCCFSILLSRKTQRQIVAVHGSDGSQKETAPDYFFFSPNYHASYLGGMFMTTFKS